ncbi:sensor histidine kinase [Tsuneonella sp. SYSU-LHT278]|uniref:sensor histidine kinase n=1 Tax=Tsuneonella sediminis TaxID=3416089 RepID=UPI003F78BE59
MFVVWIGLDPKQPVRGGQLGAAIFAVYLVIAAIEAKIAWSNWWIDFRLRSLSLAVDCAAFFLALYFTQSADSDLVSPFIAFLAFLVLAVVISWSWRSGLAFGLLLCLAFAAEGLLLITAGLDVDPLKFVRRASFMAVMVFIFVWFAHERKTATIEPFPYDLPEANSPLFERLLQYAMRETGAGGALLAWRWNGEPSTLRRFAGSLVRDEAEAGHDEPIDAHAHLFDRVRGRSLVRDPDGRIRAIGSVSPLLRDPAAALPVSGLFVPLSGNTGRGHLVLAGIAGVGVDHIGIAQLVGHELSRALDRDQIEASGRNASVTRVRADIARDLHDSVSQSLAGAVFRLASLRKIISEGRDPLPELDQISRSLGVEQASVRDVIASLRAGTPRTGSRNLLTEIALLLGRLSEGWGISVELIRAQDSIMAPASLVFELQQILREAVANAVRHGAARRAIVDAAITSAGLRIVIEDDGRGFEDAAPRLPRSIHDRVSSLGGTLAVQSYPGNTRLEITLPERCLA